MGVCYYCVDGANGSVSTAYSVDWGSVSGVASKRLYVPEVG
ncbi:MAG: hypothetical protein AVDCRST_MAG93-2025 [uncultured Chloroflexia bacterium]|uniref:Uncharacterized protein n=1 Tax=uncultured Chloroflexia bacterium TaxID=1672391 RepID=A0A6J4IN52_9CHLR|nr:MAG: hypothetical protein AVDCRST_MAG93-2025 [uncultured Chloroflexia bacterium]